MSEFSPLGEKEGYEVRDDAFHVKHSTSTKRICQRFFAANSSASAE